MARRRWRLCLLVDCLIRALSQRFNAVDRDRLGKAFQGYLANRLGLDQLLELAQGFSIGQDLPALCFAAETCRKIGDSAHRAIVEPFFKTDRTDRGVTLGDANTEREIIAML